MKKSILIIGVVILTSVAGLLVFNASSDTNQKAVISCCTEDATCYGKTPCNACKNCKYCKHCSKDGGSCGVCD